PETDWASAVVVAVFIDSPGQVAVGRVRSRSGGGESGAGPGSVAAASPHRGTRQRGGHLPDCSVSVGCAGAARCSGAGGCAGSVGGPGSGGCGGSGRKGRPGRGGAGGSAGGVSGGTRRSSRPASGR